MGGKNTKEQAPKTIGDQTVTIVENQEVHTVFHNSHELKLNIILLLLTVHTVIAVAKALLQLARKTMAKAAEKAMLTQNV